MVDYLKLWAKFYKEYPEMRSVVEWKKRLGKFLEVYYHAWLKTNEPGVDGWLKTFYRLPDFETLRRSDQEYRSSHSWLFPNVVRNIWQGQAELWKYPENRGKRYIEEVKESAI